MCRLRPSYFGVMALRYTIQVDLPDVFVPIRFRCDLKLVEKKLATNLVIFITSLLQTKQSEII